MGRIKSKVGIFKILIGMLLSVIGLALLAGGLVLKSMSDITDVDKVIEANRVLQYTKSDPIEPFPYFSYYIGLVHNSSTIYPILTIMGVITLIISCTILIRTYRQKKTIKTSSGSTSEQ